MMARKRFECTVSCIIKDIQERMKYVEISHLDIHMEIGYTNHTSG